MELRLTSRTHYRHGLEYRSTREVRTGLPRLRLAASVKVQARNPTRCCHCHTPAACFPEPTGRVGSNPRQERVGRLLHPCRIQSITRTPMEAATLDCGTAIRRESEALSSEHPRQVTKGPPHAITEKEYCYYMAGPVQYQARRAPMLRNPLTTTAALIWPERPCPPVVRSNRG